MSASSALQRGRRAHEKLMVDTCVVNRITKSTVLNEDTGKYDDVVTKVYPTGAAAAGPCILDRSNAMAREVEAGGQILLDRSDTLTLPVESSVGVDEDDIATIITSANDPALVGSKFRIEAPDSETYATGRRFRVEEKP